MTERDRSRVPTAEEIDTVVAGHDRTAFEVTAALGFVTPRQLLTQDERRRLAFISLTYPGPHWTSFWDLYPLIFGSAAIVASTGVTADDQSNPPPIDH